jgi:hypothetical protein
LAQVAVSKQLLVEQAQVALKVASASAATGVTRGVKKNATSGPNFTTK